MINESLKFGRSYAVSFERQVLEEGKGWVNAGQPKFYVSFPITARFSVSRSTGGGYNTLDMELYNLGEETRRQIFQDRYGFDLSATSKGSTQVILYAGYVGATGYGEVISNPSENIYGQLPVIFKGRLFEAGSTRRGCDIITYINAQDGAETATATQTFKTWQGGTRTDLLVNLAKEFNDLSLIALYDDKGGLLPRPVSVSGNTYEALQRYTDGHIYIDMEGIYILRDVDVINDVEILIDASTGLLETPRKNDAYVELGTLFEPRVTLSQKVKLVSTIQPEYNGTYKVFYIKHDCVISGAIGGICKSTIGLINGERLPAALNYVPPIAGK